MRHHADSQCQCDQQACPHCYGTYGKRPRPTTVQQLWLQQQDHWRHNCIYRLGDSEWSEQIPTAKNAGEYTVWYKVQGDAEYADVAEQSLTVTVATVRLARRSTPGNTASPILSSARSSEAIRITRWKV